MPGAVGSKVASGKLSCAKELILNSLDLRVRPLLSTSHLESTGNLSHICKQCEKRGMYRISFKYT